MGGESSTCRCQPCEDKLNELTDAPLVPLRHAADQECDEDWVIEPTIKGDLDLDQDYQDLDSASKGFGGDAFVFIPPPMHEPVPLDEVPDNEDKMDLEIINILEEFQQPAPVEDKSDFIFTITINKTNKLGLITSNSILRKSILKIQRVKPGGLIAEWNEDNPDQMVKEGDLIVEVNGISGDAGAKDVLYEAIAKADVLKITIRRCQGVPVGGLREWDQKPAAAPKIAQPAMPIVPNGTRTITNCPADARVQVQLDDGWRDCSAEESAQIRIQLTGGSHRFGVSARGAMYIVEVCGSGMWQTNAATQKRRRLQVLDYNSGDPLPLGFPTTA